MGLIDKLKNGSGSPLSYTNGSPVNKPTAQGPYAPGFAVFNNEDSQLHFEYSINGNPFIANQKGTVQPSQLDLNGQTPGKYDVSPGNQSRLHYEYSINNTPPMSGVPTPSTLDLNGLTPSGYQSPETGINPNNLVDLTPPK